MSVVPLGELGKAIEKELKNDIKQVKFAASKALNETAFKARQNLISAYKASFKVRNTGLPKKVTVTKATKENLQAEVLFPFDWFYLNTVGGTKRPDKSKSLMVPVAGGAKGMRMRGGAIKDAYKPAALLQYADTHPKKKSRTVSEPRAFKIKNRQGRMMIARRKLRNRKKMDWLYVEVPTAQIKKRWDFAAIVKTTAERNLNKEFDKALNWALAHKK